MTGAHPPLSRWRAALRRVLAVGLLSIVAAPCHPAPAEPPPLTLAEYRARLVRARSLLRATLDPATSARELARLGQQVRSAFPEEAQVRLPSGSVVSVDNSSLTRGLDRVLEQSLATRRRAGLRRSLQAINQLLAASTPTVATFDQEHADRVLRSVLSRPEFETKEPGPNAVEQFIAWLAELLEGLFPRTAVPAGGSEGLARVLMVVVVLLLAVLIARIVLLILPDLRRRRKEAAEAPEGELLVPREPDALLAQAEREAAEGRYLEALRLAYLATVLRLAQAGVLPEDRSRTHWELLRELRRAQRDALYQQLAPVTRRLDERLYGGRPASIDDYQACRAAHDQIERLLCAPA